MIKYIKKLKILNSKQVSIKVQPTKYITGTFTLLQYKNAARLCININNLNGGTMRIVWNAMIVRKE